MDTVASCARCSAAMLRSRSSIVARCVACCAWNSLRSRACGAWQRHARRLGAEGTAQTISDFSASASTAAAAFASARARAAASSAH